MRNNAVVASAAKLSPEIGGGAGNRAGRPSLPRDIALVQNKPARQYRKATIGSTVRHANSRGLAA